MLKNTFCHLPAIGSKRERFLWEHPMLCWEDFFSGLAAGDPNAKKFSDRARAALEDSIRRYAEGDVRYFADRLPSRELWRLFPDFRHQAAFPDINK